MDVGRLNNAQLVKKLNMNTNIRSKSSVDFSELGLYLIKILFFIPFLFSIIFSCASSRLSTLQLQSIRSYSNYQEQDGLIIAVDPYTNETRVKDFFDINLLKYNRLPVLIIIENHNKDNSFFIRPENGIRMYNNPEIINYFKNKEELINQKFGDFTAVFPIYSPPPTEPKLAGLYVIWAYYLIVADLLQIAKREGVSYNLTKNTLMEKTLLPGTANHGFIYCNIENITGDYILVIDATNIKTNKTKSFYFLISK